MKKGFYINFKKKGIIGIIIFQMVVLGGEFAGARYPLLTGKEVRLKVVPVDPRSLFRGNYARLRYEISSIEVDKIENKSGKIRNGEHIYILLTEKNNLWVLNKASFKKPSEGLYIRGRIEDKYFYESNKSYQVKYGIEAFFAKKEKALELEKNLRSGGIAVVRIARNGKAAIVDVKPEK